MDDLQPTPTTPAPVPTPTPITPPPAPPEEPKQADFGTRPPFAFAQMALLMLAVLVILGAAVLYFIRFPNEKSMKSLLEKPTIEKPIQLPAIFTTTGTTPTPPPTKPIVTTSTPTTPNQPTLAEFGEHLQLFEGDEIMINTSGTKTGLRITAKNFIDSRCQKGVQCIWAGERAVNLEVSDGFGKVFNVYLGTTRSPSATVLGSTIHLVFIDDAKGGTYAEIFVD